MVLCPSRGRPDAAGELVAAVQETAALPDTDVRIIIDEDDPLAHRYRQTVHRSKLVTWPRRRLAGTLNHAVMEFAHTCEVIGFLGDDHRPRTANWDIQVCEALVDPHVGVCYGDDKFQGQNLPTACFWDARMADELGYVCPPGQTHLYLDNFWLELGRAVGIRYLPDVVIEHMHPAAGKAQWDERYLEVNAPEVYAHDQVAWMSFLVGPWPSEAARLRAAGFQAA
jgi:hypothetical protein